MENKNGQGIFYGVIGVATLVVAIIGATFAYFSAAATSGEGDIAGNTLDISGNALSVEVTKDPMTGATATNKSLVPAVMTATAAGYNAAVEAKCEGLTGAQGDTAKYTGCHLYQIKVHSATAIQSAELKVDIDSTGIAGDKGNWKFAIWQSADPTQENKTASTVLATTDFTTGTYTILNNQQLAANDTYYYLLVYLLNTNNSQNADGTTGAVDARGSYTGTVSLSAAGGQVKATFATGV